MKIGILTQPLHNNYGGLLQNFALQQVLKGMGYEVDTLDWDVDIPAYRRLLSWCKWYLYRILGKKREKPRYKLTNDEMALISRYNQNFIRGYLSVCPRKAYTSSDFAYITSEYGYNAFVVGSDQVWRPNYNPLQTAMFLDFCEKKEVKRIAYAASFGSSEWEFTPAMTATCARLAKKFDLISVREKTGVNLCRKHLGVMATQVLDPTMLLDREDYIKIVVAEREPLSNGTLFHYILDPNDEKKALINHVAACQGIKPFTVMPKCQAENRTRRDVKNRIDDCVFPNVTRWLRGFMDAKMVIVDSFHGAVFSIIFNKPFWILSNAKRGNARFESLLDLFGLGDRMVASGENVDWNKAIDWERVNEIRQKEAERCKSLLEGAFKK